MRSGALRLILAVLLLAVFAGQAFYIAAKKSNTWDEPAHILAGYAYLKDGMDYLSPLNHPVTGRLLQATLPYLFLDLDFDSRVMPEEARESDFFPYSVKFLYENKTGGEKILFLSRAVNITLGVLLGLYVLLWSSELWGSCGGLFSLFLYALCPNILAHSSLATTDLPITAFFFISSYHLYRLHRDGLNLVHAAAAAVAMALAFTSKHTAFLLFPVAAAAFLSNARKDGLPRALKYYAFIFFGVYVLIWAVYGFRFHSASSLYEPLYWPKFSGSGFGPLFDILRSIKILPEAYLYSVAGVLSGIGGGKLAFLMGEQSITGWWHYFIVAFFIKTPIPVIILLSACLVYGIGEKREWGRILIPLSPVLLVFIVFSAQKVNIGLRHVLPAYPYIFTLLGFTMLIKTRSMKLAKGVLMLCIASYAYSAFSILPHQLAYFNGFAGGPINGHRYLVDSNLDWGQDLKGLKEFMEKNGIKKIQLAYFGLADPKHFGIDYEYLPSFVIPEPQNVRQEVRLQGWVAISATLLEGVYLSEDIFKPFRSMEPVARIGYSIYVYKI